jgi:hypothetical protein
MTFKGRGIVSPRPLNGYPNTFNHLSQDTSRLITFRPEGRACLPPELSAWTRAERLNLPSLPPGRQDETGMKVNGNLISKKFKRSV